MRIRDRHAAVLATLCAGLAAAPGVCSASYVVSSCAPEANHAWTEARSAPSTHLEVFTTCAPATSGSLRQGIGAMDVLWGTAVPPGGELLGSSGHYAEVRFLAPAA